MTPESVVRFGSARVRTSALLSRALIVALRLMPPEITLVMNCENDLSAVLLTLTPTPPTSPLQAMPRSRPASRWASRMRTSRLTCCPPVSVIVLMICGLPYWATMASTLSMVTASVTLPLSLTRPLMVETLISADGMPARIERAMSAVSAPTSTASRPTGLPSAE